MGNVIDRIVNDLFAGDDGEPCQRLEGKRYSAGAASFRTLYPADVRLLLRRSFAECGGYPAAGGGGGGGEPPGPRPVPPPVHPDPDFQPRPAEAPPVEVLGVTGDKVRPELSPAAAEFGRLSLALKQLIGEGLGDSEAAEAVRDQLDGPWHRMTPGEQEAARRALTEAKSDGTYPVPEGREAGRIRGEKS